MTKQSNKELFASSLKLVPGGVHSPVRSFKGLPTTPIFFERAEGAYIYDVEGREYIDFCMSFGPLILGHKNDIVLRELTLALNRGWSYGACEPYSLELAKLLVSKLPFIEQIRFVNSGTEAVMTALRLARGYTNKEKIIKFSGCYHGHVDSMLIKAGSGLAGTSEASSKGIPHGIANDTIVLELDSEEALFHAFESHKDQIAAVIIEPLPANNGLLIQRKEFLQTLRKLCSTYDALLIFDEVISGFRTGFGGMTEKFDIMPDLVTYGKIIGGGLPVGAVAGKKMIMEHLAPLGNVYQAGTLSANPLAMVAGFATLSQLTPNSYKELSENTQKVCQVFTKWGKSFDNGKFANYTHYSQDSLFWQIPGASIRRISDIPENLSKEFNELFMTLLGKGIYLAPNGYEVGFLSLSHNKLLLDDLTKRLGV